MIRLVLLVGFLAAGCVRGGYIRATAMEQADTECARRGMRSVCITDNYGPREINGVIKFGTSIECECVEVK